MTPSALQPYKSTFNFRTPNGRYFHCLKIIKNLSKNSLKLAERVSNKNILYVHFFVNPNLGYLHKYSYNILNILLNFPQKVSNYLLSQLVFDQQFWPKCLHCRFVMVFDFTGPLPNIKVKENLRHLLDIFTIFVAEYLMLLDFRGIELM